MSPSLPQISGAEAIARNKIGFVIARQKGSHIMLHRGSMGCVVPNHKEIKIGTLSGVLKRAGISLDDFMVAL